MEESLWPSFEEIPELSSPKQVLEEQAVAFTNQFNGKLRADIESTISGEYIACIMIITAPTLGYSFKLLTAKFQAIALYPVNLEDNLSKGYWNETFTNENGFKEGLKHIFTTPKLKNAIGNLRVSLGDKPDGDNLPF